MEAHTLEPTPGWMWQRRFVVQPVDGILCFPRLSRSRHPCGFGVDTRTGTCRRCGNRRLSLPAGTLCVELAAGSAQPVIAVLAREIASARLPLDWRVAVQRGHMAVVSQAASRRRLDHNSSISRNELVSRLADRIVVAHVSESGSLAVQLREWRHRGKSVRLLGNELVGRGTQQHTVSAK